MKTEINISVRTLVDCVLRSGDLEFEFFSGIRPTEGIRGHQTVQRSRPDTYRAEVPVCHRVETESCSLVVSGRIDGVFDDDGRVTIEEIKTTTGELKALAAKENPYHWGQLTTYGYLYASVHRLSAVDLQLTYYQLDSGAIETCRRRQIFEELEGFFNDLVHRYLIWAQILVDWEAQRDASIRSLAFPFAGFRSGQRQMAVAVYRAIRDRGQLMVQAPTGIGKTMAAIFPALKAMAEGHARKLFYLTARTTGQIAAEDTFQRLRQAGLRCKALTLTAKEKICFNPTAACSAEECEFARGYYDRLNGAILAAFGQDALTRLVVEALAREFALCPFEFSLELALWVDAVVCDYNYAFDPHAYLRRFFDEPPAGLVLLVDEAHNLVDRSREMFSAGIAKQPFMDLRRSLKKDLPAVYRSLGKVNAWFVKTRQPKESGKDQWATQDPPSDLLPLLRRFLYLAEKCLRKKTPGAWRPALLELYFKASGFLKVAEVFDPAYATCYAQVEKDLTVQLFCIDPAPQLSAALGRGAASIFFSATLAPMDYFQKLFGCADHAARINLPSPFPVENLRVFLWDGISTRYADRPATKQSVADCLLTFAAAKRGNYLVFFPSYQYLEMIRTVFRVDPSAARLIVQRPEMTERERAEFLGHFYQAQDQSLIGFAVMGGLFGEGIDLVGERLCGAAIVGVGLPGICLQRELIRGYYETSLGCGFAFAYQFPGLNRVLQAAGRVIRSESDRGVVLLIDQRFSLARYRSLMPDHWRPVRVTSARQLAAQLEGFWREG